MNHSEVVSSTTYPEVEVFTQVRHKDRTQVMDRVEGPFWVTVQGFVFYHVRDQLQDEEEN